MAGIRPLIMITMDEMRLRQGVAEMIRSLNRAPEAMVRAHERSVRWLGGRAAANLRRQIRRAQDPRNHPGLAALLQDESLSRFDKDGFEFLVYELVQQRDKRTASYYRAVERGTDWWVNHSPTRPPYLLFLGGQPSRPSKGGGTQAAVGGAFARVVGGPNQGRRTLITKPVPAYRYATEAEVSFRKANLYQRWVYEELRRVGIGIPARR